MVIDMEKKEEKIEMSKKRMFKAFKKLLGVFDELAEEGITEMELMLATQLVFQSRIITVYTRDLLSLLTKLAQKEEEEGEPYAS